MVETSDVIVSDVTRLRAERLQVPLPDPVTGFRIYDNGNAAIYHLRPATPYQR